MVDLLEPKGAAVGRGADAAPAPAASKSIESGRGHLPKPPRSDLGTIILHWAATAAMILSLVTGLRLSADAEGSIIAKSLEFMEMTGEIWTWHIVAALALVVCVFAYTLYLTLARLRRRVSLKKTIVLTLPAAPKLYWGAVNVILHWLLFVAVVTLLATGVALYIGYGGWVVTVHYLASLFSFGYIFVHAIAHYFYGGFSQWLRLFRPAAATVSQAASRHPLLIASAIGLVVAGATAATDYVTRETLYVGKASAAPVIDGTLDDAVWREARPVSILTQQGSNLGGTGESTVEMRALTYDGKIYFGIRWWDPTLSMKRVPVIKREDGWHLLHNKVDIADESDFYEDKFALMFSKSPAFGSGGSTFMGPKPLADKPPPLNGRGYHYTADGSLIDIWQWKAARGGMLGYIDDMWFAAPVQPTPEQIAGHARYQAGYDGDKGKPAYIYNYLPGPNGGYDQTVGLRRLPKDYKAQVAKMGKIDLDLEHSEDVGSQWWMTTDETVPYSPEEDAKIPVGTVLPTVWITGPYEGHRGDISGASKWKDGYWTLEMTRALKTGDAQDLDMATDLYLWAAVFDHNQTRHTRHMRPIRMELR